MKPYKKLLKLSLWKKAVLLLLIGILLLIGLFLYAIFTDKPPQFFPLNDPHANYTITKNCPAGQGWQEPVQNNLDDGYCLEYRGDNVLMDDRYHPDSKFFSITIGKSEVDLTPFVGRQVKNIKGTYTSSSEQCIQDKCIDIGGPFVVLDIESLKGMENDTRKAIETFSNEKVKGLKFMGEYYDQSIGLDVNEYKDSYGAVYIVDIKTNKVVYFNTYSVENFPKERTKILTPKEAEEIGITFAKRNIINFAEYTKNAKYSFFEETVPKMKTKYDLSWSTKKEDKEKNVRPYHSVISLDQYGNIIYFQNEFTDRG